ncbi:shikimate kinase [Usitatibacter palustris]|uniref:Shikimate kinase n=1 Tax=Usitatibacter palustris TaxID=2732487 RepID=A0A6M4H162_9PROT|nr:shikimate kinase [Usitatibacter palustris]QJR13239.1 Shikimate kinase 1 [Usitatibacter palustris]
MNIFLIGMMGAGKTTVGRALAKRLGLPFIDTDRALVERTGAPIATIFDLEGEGGFRRRESAMLAEVSQGEDAVVATGGGAVLAEENREVMRAHGTVVYLRARLEFLWDRTKRDTNRPLLATADPRATLAQILEHREPLYLACAHLIVDTGTQSAATLAGRVATALKRHEEATRKSA